MDPRISKGEKRDGILASKNGGKQKQVLDRESLGSTSLGTVTQGKPLQKEMGGSTTTDHLAATQ